MVLNDNTVSMTGNPGTLAGQMSGLGGFNLIGNGLLLLAASNTYSGVTTLTAGTLELANAAALAGSGNITFAGGTLLHTASNTLVTNNVTNSSAAIQINANGQVATYSGNLDGSNTAGLTTLGSGTVVEALLYTGP